MSYRITALFLDSRREFPHKFAELLWPEIQFTSFDRVGHVHEAFEKHLMAQFNVCFITEHIHEPLNEFFNDIERLGRSATCLFVRVRKGTTTNSQDPEAEVELEPGFHLSVHENPTKHELQLLKERLGVVWHEMEVGRRTNDLDGSINLLMRLIDDAAAQRRRGRALRLRHGVTGLVRMHAEFDEKLFEEFLSRLSESFGKAVPIVKTLKSVPLPLIRKALPCLTEEGYLGASNRVFRMLEERFGAQAGVSSGTKLASPATGDGVQLGASDEGAE